jgi:hypothetical protein
MNNQSYTIIKQYLGPQLLSYILNREIESDRQFESYGFEGPQLTALNQLYSLIQQCRIQFIQQCGFGDGTDFYLRQVGVVTAKFPTLT